MVAKPWRIKYKNAFCLPWDGSHETIRDAMNPARPALENHSGLLAIHAMPHESIYTYGATSNQGSRPPAKIQNFSEDFRIRTKIFVCFESVNLIIAFGDRIHEICFYANKVKADLIVAAYFRQPGFSKWSHGDLNQRLVARAPCEVLFVGEGEPNSPGKGCLCSETESNGGRDHDGQSLSTPTKSNLIHSSKSAYY